MKASLQLQVAAPSSGAALRKRDLKCHVHRWMICFLESCNKPSAPPGLTRRLCVWTYRESLVWLLGHPQGWLLLRPEAFIPSGFYFQTLCPCYSFTTAIGCKCHNSLKSPWTYSTVGTCPSHRATQVSLAGSFPSLAQCPAHCSSGTELCSHLCTAALREVS